MDDLPAAPARRRDHAPRLPGQTGRRGEEAAAAHLQRRGLEILARNVRTAAGEIDLIASDRATVVFAEVKTTRVRGARTAAAERLPDALERIGPRQRRRLRGLALDWLRGQPAGLTGARALRFDAIAVVLDADDRVLALEHLEAAW